MHPNARVSQLSFSATLALDGRAKALARTGVDVINMAVGEPDFPAPRAATEAAMAAAATGEVRYTPAAGTPELRERIAAYLTRTRGAAYGPDQVAVCHSTKHALACALMTLVEPGDEVLVLEPVWSSYVDLVRFAGARPVPVRPRPDLGPDPDALRAALSPRTRGVMLNSPSNPSGYVWSEAEMADLVALADERDLWLLSDEIYRRLVYDGAAAVSPVQVGGAARTIVADGASKTYAMTGYRIGFLAGPPEMAAAFVRQNSQVTGSPNAVSQAAYAAVLEPEPPEVEAMVAEFDARRRLLLAGLADLGLPTPTPRGAFYALPDVSAHLDERGSMGLCEDLLEAEALVLVPGSVFGAEGHVRLSYATSRATLERALERLGRFLSRG